MTASEPHTDLQFIVRGWRNLWRADVEALPAHVGCEPFTIFVRADGRDAAHLAIKRALHAMFPAAYQELEEAYGNLSSAPELVAQGRSARYVDRLFESARMGDKVDGWVRAPVFVAREAPELYAAWVTAQLDHSSHYASLAFVPAPGMVVDEFPAMVAQINAKARAESFAPAGEPDPVNALLLRLAGMHPDAGEIGVGQALQPLVDEARRLLALRAGAREGCWSVEQAAHFLGVALRAGAREG